jgi:adenylate cyclase
MASRKKLLYGLIFSAFMPILMAVIILRPDTAITVILCITALLAVITAMKIMRGSEEAIPSSPPASPETAKRQSGAEPDFVLNRILPAIDDVLSEYDNKSLSTGNHHLHCRLREKLTPILTEDSNRTAIMEEKEATVVLADLRGFTSIAENYSPLEVADMLNRYFTIMSKIIYHHGGIVDKFVGDSIMALFGIPVRGGNDVENALCAAIEMQIAMNEFNAENKKRSVPDQYMGIGINTGKVLAGRIGSELHSEHTVIGDEINMTSRIEAYTLRGQILISSNTYAQAQKLVTVKTPMHISVKGKRDPLIIYELLAVGPPHSLRVPEREVRKSLRAEVDFPFKFQLCFGKIVSTDLHDGRILDISTGGMLIRTSIELQAHVNIKFRLAPNITGDEGEDIYGKIIRVVKNGEHWESNIEFTTISAKDSGAINELVHRIVGPRFCSKHNPSTPRKPSDGCMSNSTVRNGTQRP